MDGLRILRAAAVLAAATTAGMMLVTGWLGLVGGAWVHRTGSFTLEVVLLPAHLVWVVAGLLLVLRLPRHPIGWLLLLVGFGYSTVNLGANAVAYTHLVRDQPNDLTAALAVVGDGTVFLAVAIGWLGIFLLFPDGTLPGRRWRWVLWAGAVSAVAYLVIAVVSRTPVYYLPIVENPMGVVGDARLLATAEWVVFLGLVVVALPAGIAALLVRWRRGDEVQRQQLRWLLCSAVLLALALGGAFVAAMSPSRGDTEHVWDAVVAVVSGAVPVAIVVAITRYRLFELDRLVSRTVTYAVVAGLLLIVYVGGVLAVQVVVPASGDLAVAVATLAAAAAFAPMRRRVRSRVDRVFHRGRFDAEGELVRFADRLRSTVEVEQVAADCLDVVARTVAPTSASVLILRGSDP